MAGPSRLANRYRSSASLRGAAEDQWLVESAPSVVDELERQLTHVTAPSAPGGRDPVPAFIAFEPLSAKEGRQVIADNYAA